MNRHVTSSRRETAQGGRPRAAGGMTGIVSGFLPGVSAIRRRLHRLLPVALFILLLQVLAPVASSWAVAAALGDPLRASEICHGAAESEPASSDRGTDRHDCALDCVMCCVLHAGTALDAPPPITFAAPLRATTAIVWQGADLALVRVRAGSPTQARAPPLSL